MTKEAKKVQTIVKLTAENVKRLKAVEITPDGKMVVISGKNAQGKSSVLDSIMFAIGGKSLMDKMSLRHGAESGEIEVETQELVIRRRLKDNGSTVLDVRRKDGGKVKAAQGVLDSMTSGISFDPLEFSRMEGKKQADEVRKLAGLDLTPFDEKKEAVFEDRAEINRRLSSKKAALEQAPYHDDAPEEEVSVNDVKEELEEARVVNRSISKIEQEIAESDAEMERIADQLNEIEEMKSRLEGQFAGERKKKEVLENNLKEFTPVEEDDLFEKMANLEAINSKVRDNKMYRQVKSQVKELTIQSDAKTKKLAEIAEERMKAITSAKMPIEGLTIGEDGTLMFNEIPLEQCSSAERLKVSVSIAMAQNPEIRIMLVRDGSLLDDESLKLLAQMAEENETQVWMEKVGEDVEGSIVIEDGMVKEK